MDIEDIQKKANYCLNCKTKPCTKGCPINTNIPEFINYIKNKEYEKAYKIVSQNNDLSHICALICPVEEQCEGACVRGIKGEPVKINELELFLSKWASENLEEKTLKIKEKNNIKVAVIGSGPAGLICSAELARYGFSVTIFEEYPKLGGILTFGIPEYRLPREILNNTINKILKLGIEVKTEVSFGKDITIESLKNEEYEYIFLGIGAKKSIFMNINNVNCKNVYGANEFLKIYNENKKIECKNVVVIGGGNVAIDAARSAKKMGATDVTIVYRRRKQDMPARDIEIEEAEEDNINFMFQSNPINIKTVDNNVVEVTCLKTEIIDGKAKNVENTEFNLEIDTIIMAIGSKPDTELLGELNIDTNENSFIIVDEFGKTNIEGVYAGGDVTNTKATVCKAVHSGKQAALGIKFASEKMN